MNMASFLEPELATIAFCWRLERRDGVCLGFTSHDRDIQIGGLVYRTAPGMLPSAVTSSDGLEPDSLDVTGALTSDAITAADLRAGRWDGAALALFMVDWTAPSADQAALARGQLGEVSVRANGFEAELKGPTALLEQSVVEQTSPECRAQLGDRRCRVDMAGRVSVTRVSAVLADDEIEVEDIAGAANAYGYGRLRWLGGANTGLESAILSSIGPKLRLHEAPPFAFLVGELVEIREGCDKRFATCIDRFGNAENFRGEPHLPGMDLLTRDPGG